MTQEEVEQRFRVIMKSLIPADVPPPFAEGWVNMIHKAREEVYAQAIQYKDDFSDGMIKTVCESHVAVLINEIMDIIQSANKEETHNGEQGILDASQDVRQEDERHG